MNAILSVRNLSTGYAPKQVLYGISFDVMRGEVLLITGGNGSGKSTLLKAICGLLPAWNSDASIVFRPNPDRECLHTQLSHRNLANGLAYVPQKNAVFDELTVEENLLLAGHTLSDRRELAARREAVLAFAPILRSLLQQRSDNISGGERAMLALGMVMLHRPKLLLLDEPTAGLDSRNVSAVCEHLENLIAELGLSLLVVEHRADVFASLAHRTMAMRLGVVEIHCGLLNNDTAAP
ncbi:MAG TPA: ATP-binding cassette domain-containing protein [Phycisphaerae bacterium]|nr:ATP-binding cassette domain-containing protein [Phycisphaerae bacterium]